MEWVETTGKTLEEAKEMALDQLGVDEVDAEFEILEQPKTGLFGRMRGEARVRARVRPTAPRSKEDRRDRRRRTRPPGSGGAGNGGAGNGGSGATAAPAAAGGGEGGETAQRRSGRPSRGEDRVEGAQLPSPASDGGAGSTSSSSNRRRRRRSKGSGGDAGAGGPAGAGEGRAGAVEGPAGAVEGPAGAVEGPAGAVEGRAGGGNGRSRREPRTEESERRDGTEVEVPLQEQASVAEDFLSGLLGEFGLTADVTVNVRDEDNLDLSLDGRDLGLLIGPKGTTLLAIQDLARTAVQHKTSATNGRIHVDIGGYRQKRSEALAKFAVDVAGRVKESGERAALEPMSAADRKVVHDALTDFEGVTTTSEGEEPRRRVVILPAG